MITRRFLSESTCFACLRHELTSIAVIPKDILNGGKERSAPTRRRPRLRCRIVASRTGAREGADARVQLTTAKSRRAGLGLLTRLCADRKRLHHLSQS
jgi:hypothetical protein